MELRSQYTKPSDSEQTRNYYLQNGSLTQPFLTAKEKAELDKRMGKANAKTDMQKIDVIYDFIEDNKNPWWKKAIPTSQKYKEDNKFKRNAGEIWEGSKMTGCTDYAMTFATIARQYGIPTTFLATVENDCAQEIIDGKKPDVYAGHSFCECFADGKWILADPAKSITEEEYDPAHIQLTGNHTVCGKQEFITYGRSLDIGHTYNSQQEYSYEMADAARELGKEAEEAQTLESEVTPVTESELQEAGFVEKEPEIEITQSQPLNEPELTNEQNQPEEMILKKQ